MSPPESANLKLVCFMRTAPGIQGYSDAPIYFTLTNGITEFHVRNTSNKSKNRVDSQKSSDEINKTNVINLLAKEVMSETIQKSIGSY